MMLKVLVGRLRSRSQPKTKDEETVMSQSDAEKSFYLKKILSQCETEGTLLPNCAEEECCVCFTQRATVMALPCGHRVTCKQCSAMLIKRAMDQKENGLKCVVCRQRIIRFACDPVRARKPRLPEPPLVPYDLNVPRALGRRTQSVSGNAIPIQKKQAPQLASSSPASSSQHR